ncbi:hypothetical protein PENTCL1PPCAC_26239, partial [Pristionchus entomophagus]
MHPIPRPELCAVCGDSAIGYHYNVASCSGCRSFFRRSIKGGKQYVCKRAALLEGRCKVDRRDQKHVVCKRCRLNAC